MSKIGLIISREYLARIKKKSFIIMTFLGPLLFAGIFVLIGWISTRAGGNIKEIEVLDESGLFADTFISDDNLTFTYIRSTLDSAKKHVENELVNGLVYLPILDNLDKPKGIAFYASGNPSIKLINSIEKKVEAEIENIKLKNSGLTQGILDGLESEVSVRSINLSSTGKEKDSSSATATGVGYFTSLLIYIFIFLYGAQCMRGVIEEKTSRIVEVIISSVKPFHLMMGKVIGIAAVGFTQIGMWIILTGVLASVGFNILAARTEAAAGIDNVMSPPDAQAQLARENMPEDISDDIMKAVNSINIPLTIGAFIFFFIGGYLLYGALFAAVGSAVDSDADTQQFMLPITIPLVAAIVSLGSVLQEPNGPFALWMSMIPLTSPVVMMMRIPFGVPVAELLFSMILLIGGFILAIWLAGRIYRIGILMHGTRINYKVLLKWLLMKN